MGLFVHLHVHTQYSLLDGAARIKDLVSCAKGLGMDSLAITDHGCMYGVIEFYQECKAQGVKPILGMETYVASGRLTEKEPSLRENAHLLLLAKNQVGYQNLMKLSTTAFLEGFYYRPRIDYDLLEAHHEGLICTTACLAGDVPSLLLAGQDKKALELVLRLKGIFGPDFYIELQNHGIREQQIVLPKLVELAKQAGVRTVATNDVHYVRREDAQAQDVLLCVQTNRFVDEEDRMRMQGEEFYLKSAEEMRTALYDYPEALDVTGEIADQCEVAIEFGHTHLPGYRAPEGEENPAYLRRLAYEGLARKLPQAGEDAKERLEYELSVIESMGYVDYFLIVWDFIHFAKTRNIQVGPGRGSGAGSLCAFCLDITDVDPLKYNLIFERFLNPERVSLPDFDIDFCYERRQEVIDYVVEKYGKDHVAQIITFGTLAAKAAIRDVGRVLRMPYGEVDKIAKLVPNVLNIKLQEALDMSGELKALYDGSDAVKQLIDLALKLEGLPRNASTHAAGVVICAVPIVKIVPLQKNDESVTTQFTMGTLEQLGLLKMDFLGLRTLTVIRDAVDFVREAGGEVDFSAMDFEDPTVYELIGQGDTDGVFQLESAGMKQFMQQLKPSCFEDIIAGISLFRPGPMDQIPRYVKGKHNPGSVRYSHPLLKPILSTTYGCIVYQEQVMQIVRDLAGYSMGRSDLMRRAMSKKKHDVMAQERQNFIHGMDCDGEMLVCGAVRKGVPERVAAAIFDEMQDFASYAFNKSHAACYAVLAYRTAYLKRHYPVAFMTALMNSFLGRADKIAEYIYVCGKGGIRVLPPSVNRSRARFRPEGEAIRFGLAGVRNVGEAAVESMIAEREKNGPFRDFHDFLSRADGFNKRMIESLIKAGCFDEFGARRAQLMAVYEREMDAAASARKHRESGQMSLFDLAGGDMAASAAIPLPNVAEYPPDVLLLMEREATGIYLSGHPLLEFSAKLDRLPLKVADALDPEGGRVKDNERVLLAGVIGSLKTKPTKNNNGMMGYAALEDLTGSIELVLFPSVLQQYAALVRSEAPVAAAGRLNMREEQNNSLLVEELMPLKDAAIMQRLYVNITGANKAKLPGLRELLRRYPGDIPVIFYDAVKKDKTPVPRDLYVNGTAELLRAAQDMMGEANVKMTVKLAREHSGAGGAGRAGMTNG